MKPGLELDKLIAEKIFGEDTSERDVDSGHTIPHFPKVLIPYRPLEYSTDIAAAMRIVEHLKTRYDKYVAMREHEHNWSPTVWYVEFAHDVPPDLENSKTYCSEETLPHAICMAALQIMEIET